MKEAKTREEVEKMIEEAEAVGPSYWHSRTPEERVWAMEVMRQKAYGYDPATTKLQRVLEFATREPR